MARFDRQPRYGDRSNELLPEDLIVSSSSPRGLAIFVAVPTKDSAKFVQEALPFVDQIESLDRNDSMTSLCLYKKGRVSKGEADLLQEGINQIVEQLGGIGHVPRYISERFSLSAGSTRS